MRDGHDEQYSQPCLTLISPGGGGGGGGWAASAPHPLAFLWYVRSAHRSCHTISWVFSLSFRAYFETKLVTSGISVNPKRTFLIRTGGGGGGGSPPPSTFRAIISRFFFFPPRRKLSWLLWSLAQRLAQFSEKSGVRFFSYTTSCNWTLLTYRECRGGGGVKQPLPPGLIRVK